jgi:Mannosyltransferase (PIG-V)
MEAASEPIHSESPSPMSGSAGLADAPAPSAPAPRTRPDRREHEDARDRWNRRRRRVRELPLPLSQVRFAAKVYLATRVLLLVVALLDHEFRHQRLVTELANWDGMWFRSLARHGYPTHVSHAQTTLGFFPLYPMVMWGVGQLFTSPDVVGITIGGVIISGLGGLIATVLVQQLATGWWGQESGRRATVLFCLFPGSVVFSMVYGEALLLPLAAGCILALERRRWVLAGVLAGLATAVQPDALALVPVCAVSAYLHLRRHGWRNRAARRSLLAPALSLTGASAFATFLWLWTGTPLANYQAQHYGWGEKTNPFALISQAMTLVSQISFAHFNHPTINMNLPIGLIGAVVLVAGVVLLLRRGEGVSIEAMVWTLSIGFLAVTSEYVPPNPRLLITAFPAVLVFAHHFKRRWNTVVVINTLLLIGLSSVTFVGNTLRP